MGKAATKSKAPPPYGGDCGDASDVSSVASSLDRIDFNDIMDRPHFKAPQVSADSTRVQPYEGATANSVRPGATPNNAASSDGQQSARLDAYNHSPSISSKEKLYRLETSESYNGHVSQLQTPSCTKNTGVSDVYDNSHSNSNSNSDDNPPQDWKSWYFEHLPEKFYRKLFVGVSILSAVVILALQCYIFALYFLHLDANSETHIKKKAIATYLALFICAEIYQCIITVSAVRLQSRNQVYLLLTFIGCMVVYSGIQSVELKHSLSPSLSPDYRSSSQGAIIAIICLLIATFLGQFYLFFIHLRNDFAYTVWKQIGASPESAKRYKFFEYYRALLYFDAFFFPAFTLQFVIMMPKVETVEFVLTIIVIPLTILLLVFADYCASDEFLYGSLGCLFSYFLGLIYAFFKVIRIYTHNTNPHEYYPGRKSLTLFAIFSIILLFTTLYFGIFVTRNFNKGMKPIVSKSWKKRLYKYGLADKPHGPQSQEHFLRHGSDNSVGLNNPDHSLGYKHDSYDGNDVQLQNNISHNYDTYNRNPQTVPAIIVD